RLDYNFEYLSRTIHDDFQILDRIEVQVQGYTKSAAERRADQTRARGCADEREPGQRVSDRPRRRTLPDDDVQVIVLHRGVEYFFNRRIQPVHLVDEQHVAFVEV